MTIEERKEYLIDKINKIEDENELKRIILKIYSDTEFGKLYRLSDEERAVLEDRSNQINNGK